MQAAVRAGLGVAMLPASASGEQMRVLDQADGLPTIQPAEIGLYRSSAAQGDAVDCLMDFLTTHLRSPEYGQMDSAAA